MLIMLRCDWPADTFRRGGIAFQRGIPVDCDESTVKLVANDLSKSLVIVSATTAKADHAATLDCAADCESFLKNCNRLGAPPAGNSADAVSAAETLTTTMAEPPPIACETLAAEPLPVGTESQPTARRKR